MAKGSISSNSINPVSLDREMILPSYSGVAFLLCWIYLLFYANSAGIEAAAPISLMGAPYTLSSTVMCVVILVIAFGPTSFSQAIMTNKVKIASSLGTSIGTAFMIYAEGTGSVWLLMTGSAITGAFSGILAQQWIVAYKRVGLKATISSFPALLALSIGICMTLMYLPKPCILAATIVSPIISGFLLHAVRKSLFPVFDFNSKATDRPLDFAIMVFPIGIFAFSSGFLDFFSYESGYTYFFYAAISGLLLLSACIFILVANRESSFSCIVIPLCFLTCIFVPFFTMFNHVPASHFISIGELGIEIALFSISVGFADFFSINSLKTYALCRVAHVLFSTTGWYAASFSNVALSDLMNSQVSLAVVFIGVEVAVVCLIVAIVKAQKKLPPQELPTATSSLWESSLEGREDIKNEQMEKTTLGSHLDSADGGVAATTGESFPSNLSPLNDNIKLQNLHSIEATCLTIGHEFGLSNREMDVFSLLARGYSASAIQRELYIAPGTVNYHTRNIYSKLNVHSKQELISLVSQPMETPQDSGQDNGDG